MFLGPLGGDHFTPLFATTNEARCLKVTNNTSFTECLKQEGGSDISV